ncbi:o-succinylbenzoate synthase [Shewanella sp. Isolate11]|uniref:o-succinylbenzoate synthase n=1 Tax=Shewanella sp. Isolate11 TaxID=2908530 RepID=UPI001EFCC131|nr:o-succinylbenzoate synthase [Shewanella sp. Isolate11]MCG9697893.1 o-succinylbenzoate synthase [Shewanella sp. Isolate11]
MILRSLSLYRYQIPLDKLLPVGNQRIDQREGLVLQIDTDTTQQQVEIAPLSGVDIDGHPLHGFSRETLTEVSQALINLLPDLQGAKIDALLDAADKTALPSLAFGLSLIHAKLSGTLPSPRSTPQVVPLIYRRQDEDLATLQRRVDSLSVHVHTVKVKVGQTSIEDEIQLIHQILGVRPDLKLRLDANRAFTLQQAIDFCACLPLDAIDYIEEPCIHSGDNPQLYKALGIAYALDESLNDPGYDFIMQPGLKALVLKPMLIGHLNRLQTLIEQANADGVKSVISSSLEASLGIAALAAISAECTPNEIPGLDTLNAFSCDLLVSTGKPQCLTVEQLTLLKQLG